MRDVNGKYWKVRVRRCYRYLLNEQSDNEFFSANSELVSQSQDQKEEISEKEYQENYRLRCYYRYKYMRDVNGKFWKVRYRKCYRVRLENENMSDEELFSMNLKPVSEKVEKKVEISEKEY